MRSRDKSTPNLYFRRKYVFINKQEGSVMRRIRRTLLSVALVLLEFQTFQEWRDVISQQTSSSNQNEQRGVLKI